MISTTNLGRRFGDRVAVENLTLEIQAGEVFALLGPNGAGKTSTLRMLAGLIAPTSGTAVIDGVGLDAGTAHLVRARVGFLTEAPGHWERLSVRANLMLYARLYGLRAPSTAVDRVLGIFELADRARCLVAELSKGMKQKLALARAIVHDPRIVLLDEPTSGLDPQTSRGVRDLIIAFGRQGKTVIISTHNLDEAERVADRVAVLQTRLIAVDSPSALRNRLFGHRVRIELAQEAAPFAAVLRASGVRLAAVGTTELWIHLENPDVEIPRLVRTLVSAGADVRSVVPEQAPLEDIYLKLVQ